MIEDIKHDQVRELAGKEGISLRQAYKILVKKRLIKTCEDAKALRMITGRVRKLLYN